MDDPNKEIIETALGSFWLTHYPERGTFRIWWPSKARVGELVKEVIQGRAYWDPKTYGWYVPPSHRDEVYVALQELSTSGL
ncbi:hypothetical protein [Beijerinckia mobilis]|uniref:hypothetical protein n=1 Tax=Beijerinckia mobilis TaxID=231434 RepID=UPI00055650F2|nr:hypothetical protein [Beijerinckia mobilis]